MGYSIFDETMVEMSWPEIEAAIKQKAVVLLPVGVIEEHGPHMGLAVDTYAVYIVARLTKHHLEEKGIRTLIAPPYYWGINGLTSSFPGSFTIRPATMKALLLDILESLRNWGVSHVFALNWHGEWKHSLTALEAMKEGRSSLGLKACYLLTDAQAANFKLSGKEEHVLIEKTAPAGPAQYLEVHAGASETGVMLHYFPEHVKADVAKTLKPSRTTAADLNVLRKGGDTARKMIPQGYIGEPAAFDIEGGKREVEEKAAKYAEMIEGVVGDSL